MRLKYKKNKYLHSLTPNHRDVYEKEIAIIVGQMSKQQIPPRTKPQTDKREVDPNQISYRIHTCHQKTTFPK